MCDQLNLYFCLTLFGILKQKVEEIFELTVESSLLQSVYLVYNFNEGIF